MQKKNRGALSVLSLTVLLSMFAFSPAARADQMLDLVADIDMWVQRIGQVANEISAAIEDAIDNGQDGGWDERLLKAITGVTPGDPYFDGYNTNFILSGGALDAPDPAAYNSPVSKTFNILSLAGGIPSKMTGPMFSGEYFDPTTYNNNSLLQNALLGSSGTGPTALTTTSSGTATGAVLWVGSTSYVPNINGNIYSTMDNNGTIQNLFVNQVARAVSIAKPLHYSDTKIYNDGVEVPDTMANDPARAFAFRCDMGFNPNWGDTNAKGNVIDVESGLVLSINPKCGKDNHDNVRKDRQLNSLLNPVQFVAPTDMKEPLNGAPGYYRFDKRVKRADHAKYVDLIAAASFCTNVSLKAYPDVPSSTDTLGTVTKVMYRETIDSKIVSDCWQFFEERVAYPKGSSGSFAIIYEHQHALCTEDYNKHIISESQLKACEANGRSALQARRDLAYRAYSPVYVAYLNTLGVQTRELILAQAMGEVERFEQTLLMERQIMTEAMALPERSPIGKDIENSSTKVRGASSSSP
ncbi:MAG: hypothetical protein PHW76_00090 [Alphaproteobacteria bacterium]|nr:hypothetical protein [Alphaproteobacteria bacterium]